MLRARFPILKTKTFLNSCSKGALSHDVKAAYAEYLSDWETLGSPWGLWVEKLEQTRESFARLINADPDEVAVVTSVSAAVSALASALDFSGARNRVLVSDFEFPAVAQIWHAQASRGAQVAHVPEQGAQIALESYEDALDERTLLVSAAHVCYRHGGLQDAHTITELAHAEGALVLLDAYQSLGTMPIDVKALHVDVLVGGALKYLLGSSGLAFMYVRRDLIPKLSPTATGWFAQQDVMKLGIHAHEPSGSARRFEAGTPAVPNLYAGLAGLDLVHSVGAERIQTHLRTLTDAIKAGARARGYRLATTGAHGALVALGAERVEELVTRLGQDSIIVSHRDGNLRVSPHFYNDLEDVERLLGALEQHEGLLEREKASV